MKWMVAPLCAALLVPLSAEAQDLFIYPSKGQSQEQQDRDRYECHSWASQQTGFDPTRSAPPPGVAPPPKEAQQGGLMRGGLRGGAIGAVGGAIGGDVKKGAAIGAGTGALIGGFRRNDQKRRQKQERQNYRQAQAQQDAAYARQRDSYNRAMAACLQGRGYTVN
jgi:hypothetical protein